MNSEIDLKKSDEALDAFLDEINKLKRQVNQLQSENRTLRTNEIKLNKLTESFKIETENLKQELLAANQHIRQLEIELTLPTSERTLTVNRFNDPFPKEPAYKKFNWSFAIVPVVAIAAVFVGKLWAQKHYNEQIAASLASVTTLAPTPSVGDNVTANTSTAVEEGYLFIENPLEADGMVRVMDGYGQKARVLAWVNPKDKFKIRAQSPTKMRRTYVKDGKNVTFEDYFYKISDREQWVFGYFTNRRSN